MSERKLKLHTRILGTGPDIMLVHGIGTHSGVWDTLAEKLKNNYRLTIVDLPGCGKTPLSDEDRDVDVIVQKVLEASPPSAYWLSWSFGGILSIKAALAAPQKVKKLISMATSPRSTKDVGWPGVSPTLWKWISSMMEENQTFSFVELTSMLYRFSSAAKMDPETKKQLEQSAETSSEGIKNILNILRHTDVRPLLPQLPCDSILLFGQNDPVVSASLVPLIGKLAPKVRTQIIENAGHVPFLSNQETCLQIINDFFR